MTEKTMNLIKDTIDQKTDIISAIDDSLMGEVVGVSQAMGELKDALNTIDLCLDKRLFEKASHIGYTDVASAFVFLQRCLGGMQDKIIQKEKLIQDICLQMSEIIDDIHYENIAPFVESKLQSLKPQKTPEKIEIFLGHNTLEKLNALKKIRQTPIEHLAELILATTMKDNEAHWRANEENKPVIPHIHREEKDSYSGDEVVKHLNALSEQDTERRKNLY